MSRLRLGSWFWLGVAALCVLPGCVERRMVIISDPYGAIVYDENNRSIGAAPVVHPFTYYGTYRFRLVAPGYETLVIEEKIRAPWYEWAGLDFISENLLPFTIRDVRIIRPTLQPLQVVPTDAVLQQAQGLRDYGHTIGTLIPTTPPVGPQPAPPVVPAAANGPSTPPISAPPTVPPPPPPPVPPAPG